MSRYEQQANKGFSRVFIITLLFAIIVFAVWMFWGEQQEPMQQVTEIDIPKVKSLDVKNKKDEQGLEWNEKKLDGAVEIELDNVELHEQENLKDNQTLPALETSDVFFRQALGAISVDLLNWFEVENVISKYIVIVNDLAQNQIVFKHRGFLKPTKAMRVKEDNQGLYLSQGSYSRYDHLVNVVVAIDEGKAIQLYLRFKPLFEQVYKEFSYPAEYKLEDVFLKAAANVIGAPIIESRIALVPHSIRYKFADKKLEQLSDVDKQMIRMGPENTRKIQSTFRKLVQALVKSSE